MVIQKDREGIVVEKRRVFDFWSAHPLGSYEIKEELGSPEFIKRFESIRDDSSSFVMDFFRFSEMGGRKVLDVGCGPGWVSHKYAEQGAQIFSFDLTYTAVRLATKYFAKDNLRGRFVNADAERIPFKNEQFDFVSCDGVLHHTPETEMGLREINRVLKKDGRAVISLYYENILLRGHFFLITKFVMRLLRVRMHGVKELPMALSKEDFGKFYDGVDNPLGRIYSRRQCEEMLRRSGFQVVRSRVYFFPKRFFPSLQKMPVFFHRLCDRFFGTMIFFEVKKA